MARLRLHDCRLGFAEAGLSGRVLWAGLLSAALAPALAGCGASQVDSIQIAPASTTVAANSTAQFTASGVIGHGSHPSTTQDVTSQVAWTSSAPTVATINASGLATGVSPGTATITATMNGFTGTLTATATLTVTGTGGGTVTSSSNSIVSLTIIPNSITVGNLQDTGQFLAVGTFSSSPTVQDVTNSPNLQWISSFPNVFPVDNSNGTNTGTTGGIVTAYGNGSADIIAVYTDPKTGSIQTATATFSCPLVEPDLTANPPTPGSCYPGSQAAALDATITIYNEGLNTTGWLVTAPSATGTPDVIHCGPGWTGTGGSVCSAAYPIGTTITLTAPAVSGVNFGGWSSSCTTIAPNPATAAGPNTCTLTLTSANPNVTIGAIFN